MSQVSFLDLLSRERDEDADDEAPALFQNSPYYDDDGLKEILRKKQKVFSLISLNVQSLNAKFDQLKILIENLKNSSCYISALCVQETWLTDASDVSLLQLDGYHFVSRGRSCSAHGGVALYILDTYDFKILEFNSRSNIWDGLFIEVTEKNFVSSSLTKKLIIANIYRPPRDNIENYRTFNEELNEILSKLQQSRQEVVVVGDFNLDLLKIQENQHIKDYFECILSNGFIPKITFPTRLSRCRGTLIDNVFVKLSHDFSETTAGILWHNISDHQPCFVTLDYLTNSFISKKYVKVYVNTPDAIAGFKAELADTCSSHKFDSNLTNDPNINYNILNNNILSALQNHLPIKTVKFQKHKHKKNDWITFGIIRSIKYRDRLYADLHMTDANSDAYESKKQNLATYNRILKQNIRLAKKNYYQQCFEKFKDDVKKTWSAINGMLSRTKELKDFPKYFLIHGQYVSDIKTISNEFNKFFVTVGNIQTSNIALPQNRSFEEYLTTPVNQNFHFHCVNKLEIYKIIDNLKPKSSTGIDGLSNKLLKQIKFEISDILTVIINQSLTTGIFPEKLKLAKVIPLFKKGDNSLFSNYRPISILPSLSKVIERIMHSQIQQYFNKNKLLFESQYGFRPEHSTELAALEVIDRILTQMDNNEICINLFLDLSKAFDCLDHDVLLHKLQYYGFSGISLNLMRSYLCNRKQLVRFNDMDSDYMLIKTGVPQGSILGPLLFLIYINDIINATSCF
jgi:hypothetical protein